MTQLQSVLVRLDDDRDYQMTFKQIPYGFTGVILANHKIEFTIIFDRNGFTLSSTPDTHPTLQKRIANALKPFYLD